MSNWAMWRWSCKSDNRFTYITFSPNLALKEQIINITCNTCIQWSYLTLSHPEALLWRVKLSGVRQSKITKCPLLATLGGKGLKDK